MSSKPFALLNSRRLPRAEMQLIPQFNEWICGVGSLAMCSGLKPDDIIAKIGHDGSEVIDPNGTDITKVIRGFHDSELALAAFQLGFYIVDVIGHPVHNNGQPFTKWHTIDAIMRVFGEGTRFMLLVESTRYADTYHYIAYEYPKPYALCPVQGKMNLSEVTACILVKGVFPHAK